MCEGRPGCLHLPSGAGDPAGRARVGLVTRTSLGAVVQCACSAASSGRASRSRSSLPGPAAACRSATMRLSSGGWLRARPTPALHTQSRNRKKKSRSSQHAQTLQQQSLRGMRHFLFSVRLGVVNAGVAETPLRYIQFPVCQQYCASKPVGHMRRQMSWTRLRFR